MKTMIGAVPLRNESFYNEALEAASRGEDAFEYNDWPFKTEDALADLMTDIRRGSLKASMGRRAREVTK